MNDSPTEAREIDSPYRPPQAVIDGASGGAIGGVFEGVFDDNRTMAGRLVWWQWCLWGLLAIAALVRVGVIAKSTVLDRQTLTFAFAVQDLLPAILALAAAGLILIRPAATFLLGTFFYLMGSITYLGPEGMWLTRSFSRLGFDLALDETRLLHVNAMSLLLFCACVAAFVKARAIGRR
ncbi:MAG: hypothetical protein KA144_11985 [Xanthomonadaceae bacterium]|nr:hypothetical protein [Xanthomonadaceae bacterium]